jgi:hypothetical protein
MFYRAFASAVYAALATAGFFLAILLGQPLADMLAGLADVPDYLVRLVVYAGLFLAIVGGGSAVAKRFWLDEDIPLVSPIDPFLGFVFGLIGGLMTASLVAFVCFAHPRLEVVFYPPAKDLTSPIKWNGPDPILHLPYRAMQLVSALDRATGGGGFDAGEQGARWITGPVGQNFNRAYVRAEELKQTQPIEAVKAWEHFQANAWEGVTKKPPTSRAEAIAAPWLQRAANARTALKPHIEEKDKEFLAYIRTDCIGTGNLDALERAILDWEQFFPEHQKTKEVAALADVVGHVREIRALGQDQRQAAISKLRVMQQNCPADSLALGLTVREIGSLGGASAAAVGGESAVKAAEKQAFDLVDRFQFDRALQALRALRLQAGSEGARKKLDDQIYNVEALDGLHKNAVKAINQATPKKSLPKELGLGEGVITSATASNLAIRSGDSASGPSWSQLGPRKVRTIYALFLGPNPDGIKVYDWYFELDK